MSESMNDKGKGLHPVLHKGYGDPKFKYKTTYPDPPGQQWQQLKSILKNKLASGDFKTLWKAIASAPSILSKALTEANLNAAYDSTGAVTYAGYANYQRGITKDPSDKQVIMSSNPHFATKITTEQGQRVLDCIDLAADIVDEKDIVPEEEYPELLGDADNCPVVTGMELGLMAVNRQRCCILGEGLFAYREQKKAAAAKKKEQRKQKRGGAAAGADSDDKTTKKRKTTKTCSNALCMLDQGENITGWFKCSTNNCRKWFCPKCSQDGSKDTHHTVCQRNWDAKQVKKA